MTSAQRDDLEKLNPEGEVLELSENEAADKKAIEYVQITKKM